MENKSTRMEEKLIKSLSGILSLNQRILLSGPSGSEIYQETLIKALAKNFAARLLIVDSLVPPVNERRPDSSGDHEFEILGVGELIEVMWEESISGSLIVLVKDVEKALMTGRIESHALANKLPPGVLIIGSHTEKDNPKDKSHPAGVTRLSFAGFNSARQGLADMNWGSSGSKLQAGNKDATNSMQLLNTIFPNKISIELPKTSQEGPPRDGDHSSSKSERSEWRYLPPISARACVAPLGTTGKRLQTCSTFVAGYHGTVTHISDFMRQVATYAPTSSGTPATLIWIASACGDVGTFLGHLATTMQGAAGVGQMLGAGFRGVARLFGPEPGSEAVPGPAKIIVYTVEQAEQVIKWTVGAAVEIDVGLDVTPATAVDIYNEFRTAGSEALALISGGENMVFKRAMFYSERSA